jgi:exopolysaccharide biosynthesis polyprenyl glycosylphosphotransferase
VLVVADWLCAVLATWAIFPADVMWPALGLVPAAWISTTGIYRLYERRHLGPGSEEFRLVFRAAFAATAAVSAFCAVLIHSDRDMRSVLLVLPVTGGLSILSRHLLRRAAARLSHPGTRRTMLVGTLAQTNELAALLRKDPSGLRPVAACLTSRPHGSLTAGGHSLPVLAVLDDPPDLAELSSAVVAAGCDTVIALPGPHLTAAALGRFGWQLENQGVELFIAPFLKEIAASRLAVRQSGGVPLVHVRAPQLSRAARLPKEVAERFCAVVGMILLAPVFAVIAVMIVRSSGRPVFFRQTRIGLRGAPFTLVKFRTMTTDAEDAKARLADLNVNGDGPLFKVRSDPRVTPVGAILRRYSLDELPQLWNVASGSMSLVGPRPPLPEEAAAYDEDVRRRLLVKPGLTGLWQVSGRSDLPWDEAVRLDLGYVENWSLALDAAILLRTGSAVLKGTGAY